MNTHAMTRRRMLELALLGGTAGLAACTVGRSGTVTTATIDVTRLLTDSRGILSALTAALALPGVPALLGTNLTLVEASMSAAASVMTEIAQATGGTVTLSIDTAHVQALVVSLLSDAQTVLALLQPQTAAARTAMPTQLATILAAVATLVPLVQLAAGLASAAPRALPMSEAEALRIAAGA